MGECLLPKSSKSLAIVHEIVVKFQNLKNKITSAKHVYQNCNDHNCFKKVVI